MKKVEANPEFRGRVEKVGARPVGNTPAEFTAQIKSEIARMKQIIKDRNIKLDD